MDARELIPYLHDLGVSDLYASPRFRARKGSSHGYDVADPLKVNSELGTDEEFEEMVERLRQYQMGLLLDIVPNHMAASHENPWWTDVLESGPGSPYARFFDINWHPTTTKAASLQENRVLVPVLGDVYGKVLENQEISLKFDDHGFFVSYGEVRLPLDPGTALPILQDCLNGLRESFGEEHLAWKELADLAQKFERLPPRTATDPKKLARRQAAKEVLRRRLWALYHTHAEIKLHLDHTLRFYNGIKGSPASFDSLDALLSRQAYRLAFWKLAAEEINYRRFFDVSDLVCLRVEDPDVFAARHALITQLVRGGKVNGLRVDHIDGVADALAYLQRLQAAAGGSEGLTSTRHLYVVVEKILEGEETLPAEWPVSGTTGYDFLNAASAVFVHARGFEKLSAFYRRFTGKGPNLQEACYESKKLVMGQLFAGEVNALLHELGQLGARDRHARDVPLSELAEALVETTACLPVYRTYIRDFDIPARDRAYIEQAVEEAQRRTKPERAGAPAFDFLRRVLLLEPDLPDQRDEAWLQFVVRWQQFTGPVMAKGFEDTALYSFFPLSSLNEVGASVSGGVPTLEGFHSFLESRARHLPQTLNATSTHDTKRSEDVRARLHVLSEMPKAYAAAVRKWSRWNRPRRRVVDGGPVPSENDEYLIYQTLLGAWPLTESEVPTFKDRMKEYVLKAAREAKSRTSWVLPNPAYEKALEDFVEGLFSLPHTHPFLRDFLRLERKVAFYGAFNSLAQVLLKVTAPGVPDFYQGSEIWDFSLVDPDNRRPVDFRKRLQLLEELKRHDPQDRVALVQELLENWPDGRIKLYVTWKSLEVRRALPEVFLDGPYIPLPCSGRRAGHVLAYARQKGEDWVVVVLPRLISQITPGGTPPLGRRVWGGTEIELPAGAPTRWHNTLTGEEIPVETKRRRKSLPLSSLLKRFPLALLSRA